MIQNPATMGHGVIIPVRLLRAARPSSVGGEPLKGGFAWAALVRSGRGCKCQQSKLKAEAFCLEDQFKSVPDSQRVEKGLFQISATIGCSVANFEGKIASANASEEFKQSRRQASTLRYHSFPVHIHFTRQSHSQMSRIRGVASLLTIHHCIRWPRFYTKKGTHAPSIGS